MGEASPDSNRLTAGLPQSSTRALRNYEWMSKQSIRAHVAIQTSFHRAISRGGIRSARRRVCIDEFEIVFCSETDDEALTFFQLCVVSRAHRSDLKAWNMTFPVLAARRRRRALSRLQSKNPQALVRRWKTRAAATLAGDSSIRRALSRARRFAEESGGRATARSIAPGIACEIQPIPNLRVLSYLQAS